MRRRRISVADDGVSSHGVDKMPVTASPFSGALRNSFFRNLSLGFRLACLRPAGATAWQLSPVQLILLLVAGFAVNVALARTYYGDAAIFNWYSLSLLWADLPLWLFVGWIAAQFGARRVKPLLMVPVAMLAASVTVAVVLVAFVHIGQRLPAPASGWVPLVTHYGGYVWLLLIAVVLLYRSVRLARRAVLVAVLPLLAASAYYIYYPSGAYWYEMPGDEAGISSDVQGRESPASEEMLYLQPRLAQESIRALARQRPGVADLYFIGFAPYAHEDVFWKESETIRRLMDERFDARNRSLLLVNHRATLRSHPLATVTNLRAALMHAGKTMNRNEDVLVLYLTSHGDKKHQLSSRYYPLHLQEIDPVQLRQMLDEAGIKWRVVIVSACYSGGYIEPLRSDHTLVMTAADAASTSFGCGAGSDFTYFAKALFDEQLRQTYSFEQAFEHAVPVIRAREQVEQESFSNPQIAVGQAIRAKLAQIERRLEARTTRQVANDAAGGR